MQGCLRRDISVPSANPQARHRARRRANQVRCRSHVESEVSSGPGKPRTRHGSHARSCGTRHRHGIARSARSSEHGRERRRRRPPFHVGRPPRGVVRSTAARSWEVAFGRRGPGLATSQAGCRIDMPDRGEHERTRIRMPQHPVRPRADSRGRTLASAQPQKPVEDRASSQSATSGSGPETPRTNNQTSSSATRALSSPRA